MRYIRSMEAVSPRPGPSRLLTVKQVADQLSVSTRTVWRLVRTQKLEVVRFGGNTRIPEESVVSLISEGSSSRT